MFLPVIGRICILGFLISAVTRYSPNNDTKYYYEEINGDFKKKFTNPQASGRSGIINYEIALNLQQCEPITIIYNVTLFDRAILYQIIMTNELNVG